MDPMRMADGSKQTKRQRRLLVVCQGSLDSIATLTRVVNLVRLLRDYEDIQLHVAWLLDSSYRTDSERIQWAEEIRQEWDFPYILLYTLPLRRIGLVGRLVSAGIRFVALIVYIKRHKIEAVQGHSMWGIQGVLLRLGRLLGFRAILDMQGAYPEEEAYRGATAAVVRRLDDQEGRILHGCDSVFCVSRKMVEHIVHKHKVSAHKTRVIPCCVPSATVGRSAERRTQIREAHGWQDKCVIVYSGGTAQYQRVRDMCALFAKIARQRKDAIWLVMSWGDRYLFKRHLAECGVDEHLFSLQCLAQKDVHDYLTAGDVGLLLREDHVLNRVSSPTKFAEYLAAGLPVIATPYVGDVAGCITREEIGILVDLPPASDIRDVTTFLTRVKDDREGYARRCLDYAKREWVWERHSAELSRGVCGVN